MSFCQPIRLDGRHARLEPLQIAHRDALVAAASDGALWTLWYTSVPSPDTMATEIERRLDLQSKGLWLPFTIRRTDDDTVCGMTNYLNIDAQNRRVEIGGTWYAKSVQRTGVNTEAKLLLLTHAFEALHCVAVEFRTHWMNHQSREAIARLGAKQDGMLRNHMIMPDGTYRDTVVFSILESEWPMVKRHLQYKLARHA
jgi:RimJ/RimL family protein N-acetyltransferase